MRAFGYRELGVVVLPFLGAVAFGRKDDAGPWQKLVVLLAGPLPGLILAVVCLEIAMAGAGRPIVAEDRRHGAGDQPLQPPCPSRRSMAGRLSIPFCLPAVRVSVSFSLPSASWR